MLSGFRRRDKYKSIKSKMFLVYYFIVVRGWHDTTIKRILGYMRGEVGRRGCHRLQVVASKGEGSSRGTRSLVERKKVEEAEQDGIREEEEEEQGQSSLEGHQSSGEIDACDGAGGDSLG